MRPRKAVLEIVGIWKSGRFQEGIVESRLERKPGPVVEFRVLEQDADSAFPSLVFSQHWA